MKKKRPRRRRASRAAKQSTALVRAQHVIRETAAAIRTGVLERGNGEAAIERRVADDLALGELGLVELKLTPKEEAILSEPVKVAEVLIKPTGQPYLSHPSYTRWFNRAFGRTGWALVPVSKPMKSGNSVVCPYVLHVHRQPVAFAMGEQEYFETNRDQSYGDALESTVASALRRCAKRLGVGLELWERPWLDRFIAEYGVRVIVEGRDGRQRVMWRRRDAALLVGEIGLATDRRVARDDVEPAQRPEPPRYEPPRRQGPAAPAGHDVTRGDVISDKQRKRLWAISRNSGRSEEEIRGWLDRRFGWTSTKQVTRREYEFVCASIESPGRLPEKGG